MLDKRYASKVRERQKHKMLGETLRNFMLVSCFIIMRDSIQ